MNMQVLSQCRMSSSFILSEFTVRQGPRCFVIHDPANWQIGSSFSNVQQRVMQQILQGWLEGAKVRLCFLKTAARYD